MIGLVLASHGALAKSLLETATEIVGRIDPAVAVSVGRHQSLEDIEQKLRDAIEQVDRGDGILLLVDMFGGTASNVALGMLERGKMEVVTGFNLPMLLKLSSLLASSNDPTALARTIKAYGQKHVVIATEMVHDVLNAFVNHDAEAALRVIDRDRAVDDFYNSIFRTLLTFMMENPHNIGQSTHLLFIAKNVERVGDHATNIAEMVYYAATGKYLGDRPKGPDPLDA